jgi:hypothetical protein
MRLLFIILLALVSTPSFAEGYSLVGVKCNPHTDRLIVYYYDTEDGDYVSLKRSKNEWTESDFFGLPTKEARGEKREMARTCVLSHGTYTVRIFPDEDNPNANGECGASVSLMVDILRGKEWILVRHRLDSAGCNDPTGVTTTRIVIDAKSKEPRVTQIPSMAAEVPPNTSLERTRER